MSEKKLSLHDAFVGTAVAYQIQQQPGSDLMEWIQNHERQALVAGREMTEEEMEEGSKQIVAHVASRAQVTLERHLKRSLEEDEWNLVQEAAEIILEIVGVLDTDPQAFNPDQ